MSVLVNLAKGTETISAIVGKSGNSYLAQEFTSDGITVVRIGAWLSANNPAGDVYLSLYANKPGYTQPDMSQQLFKSSRITPQSDWVYVDVPDVETADGTRYWVVVEGRDDDPVISGNTYLGKADSKGSNPVTYGAIYCSSDAGESWISPSGFMAIYVEGYNPSDNYIHINSLSSVSASLTGEMSGTANIALQANLSATGRVVDENIDKVSQQVKTTKGRTGLTQLLGSRVDDNYYQTGAFGFNFPFYGVNFTTAYIGTNGYITFGSGSTTYSGISKTTAKGLFVAAADYYGDWIGWGIDGETIRIRYEGDPRNTGLKMIWEAWLYLDGTIELACGENGADFNTYSSPQSFITNQVNDTTAVNYSPSAGKSFVFIPKSGNTTYSAFEGSYAPNAKIDIASQAILTASGEVSPSVQINAISFIEASGYVESVFVSAQIDCVSSFVADGTVVLSGESNISSQATITAAGEVSPTVNISSVSSLEATGSLLLAGTVVIVSNSEVAANGQVFPSVNVLLSSQLSVNTGTPEITFQIDSANYTEEQIVEFTIDSGVLVDQEFELGTTVISKLTFRIKTSNAIPTNAKVIPFVDQTQLGVFYVDTRKKIQDVWEFICYDSLFKANVAYVSSLSYPTSMQAVWDEITTSLSLQSDTGVSINPSYQVQTSLGGAYSKRQALGFIAGANGANLIIGKDGKLRFCPVGAAVTKTLTGSDTIKLQRLNPDKAYSRVIGIVSEDVSYEAGTGSESQTFYIENPLLTEVIVNDLYTKINGLTYAPVDLLAVGDASLYPGDMVAHSEGNSPILNLTYSYKGGLLMSIQAPSISEQRSEFDIDGSFSAELNRIGREAVRLGKSYYGVTFTKEDGLIIERNDQKSKAVFNSDEIAMKAKDENGSYVDKLYFNPVDGEFYFGGKLTVEAIDALEVVTNVNITNVLSAQNGYIAKLTVDELETSDKVQRYLNSDTTTMNFVRIKDQYLRFITAITDGTQTEQVQNRDGSLLFWKTADKTELTLEDTGIPVLAYVYNELVKMSWHFDDADPNDIPYIVMGAGTGTGDNGKGFIRKTTTGLELEYISTAGETRKLTLDEDGITTEPSVTGGATQGEVYMEYAISPYSSQVNVTFGNVYSDIPAIVANVQGGTTDFDAKSVMLMPEPIKNEQNEYTGAIIRVKGATVPTSINSNIAIHAICTGFLRKVTI